MILRVEGLRKRFPAARDVLLRPVSFVHAVDGITFEVRRGETLGLAGESGCGKTTTAKLLVRLLAPDAGSVAWRFNDASANGARLAGRELRAFRRRVQMIFQDPYDSLNSRRTVFDTVVEPLAALGVGLARTRRERVLETLASVGLTPPAAYLFRYPHELSGGQRQRVAIARALVAGPAFIAADEPTSMLDVSVRAGIMQLLLGLQERLSLSCLYITHDLAVARYMCHRIAIMYLGKIVETGETEDVLQRPQHPYTRALIAAVREPGQEAHAPVRVKAGPAQAVDPPHRCRFYERCPIAGPECAEQDHPPLEDHGGGHLVACYRAGRT